MFPYIKVTDSEKQEMLQTLGVKDIDALFSDIPEPVKLKRELNLPEALSEMELVNYIKKIGKMNKTTDEIVSFLGAGVYNHYIPSVINHILLKPEFYTAYTPYQPEISQGTLQAIFEYQTMICEITGMDVSNASVYDGATATVEAMLMCCEHTKRTKVLYSGALHPETIDVLKTYAKYQNIELVELALKNGITDVEDVKKQMSSEVASVIVQSPNYYGLIEYAEEIGQIVHEDKKATFIMNVNPLSLGMLKSPGELGADVAVGDGQPLGISQGFGGPHLGFMAAKASFLRKLPGRIAGETVDTDGKRAFVLTLQAREQHIRREKASSNICSNQALLALAASIYMVCVGKEGFKELSEQLIRKAHYLQRNLTKIQGVSLHFAGPYFNEFVIDVPQNAKEIQEKLLKRGYFAGLLLDTCKNGFENSLMLAVTEKHTKDTLDEFAKALEEVLA